MELYSYEYPYINELHTKLYNKILNFLDINGYDVDPKALHKFVESFHNGWND